MSRTIQIAEEQEMKLRDLVSRSGQGETGLSEVVGEAIDDYLRRSLLSSGGGGNGRTPDEAARAMDALRRRIGPLGFPVSELIAEGRGVSPHPYTHLAWGAGEAPLAGAGT